MEKHNLMPAVELLFQNKRMTEKNTPKPYLFTDGNPNTSEDYATSILRLKKPAGIIDVVLDTDTYNEVDDQYALAYLIQSGEKLHIKGIYAAPFYNHHSESPGEGMEKSYEEILKILKLVKAEQYSPCVYKGADRFLKDEDTPADSQAARDLIRLAMNYTQENPLYVIGIAACTNIASAILLEPRICSRMVVVWLGGLGFDWHDNQSFNAGQDIAAARVLLGSKVPLVLIPGRGVVDHFTTTGPELTHWLRGRNEFCDYILDKTISEAEFCNGETAWSRPISDVVAVAWLLDDNFMLDRLEHSPVMEYDHLYAEDKRRIFIKYVYSVNRDRLMGDMFRKLAAI